MGTRGECITMIIQPLHLIDNRMLNRSHQLTDLTVRAVNDDESDDPVRPKTEGMGRG